MIEGGAPEAAGTEHRNNEPGSVFVTIADVARAADVHPSTVSRVLSGSARVRPATRERVQDAARRLSYRPSRSARALASRRSMTVGVLLPDLRNLMHADFLRGAQSVLQDHGYSLFICDGQRDPDVQAAELDRFFDSRVDAVMVTRSFTMASLLDPFIASGIPVEPVEVLEPSDAHDLVLRRSGSRQAIDHLLDLGHRRFAIFVLERRDAPERSAEMNGRISALRQAVIERGLRASSVEVVPINEPDDCIREVARLVAPPERPTATIGGNDWMSAPLLIGVARAGLRIPEDVTVISYGDSRWSEAYRPPLSVIRYDYHTEGRTLALRILGRLGVDAEADGTTLDSLAPEEFVLRDSCGPPPTDDP